MTKNKSEKNDKLIKWLPVISFIIIAIVFRLYRTSAEDHYLLAGSDGPYLPLQVKNMFEHYRLAFPDMPLLFTLCSILAKLLYFLHVGTENECILLSVRYIDAFLPPLSAIPVFLIARELKTESIKSTFFNYLMVAFAILSFTPLLIFSHQLQKNGLAIVWVFFYLFYALKIIKYENRKDIFKAIIVLILCALTHLGSFGLVVFISFVIFIFWFIFQKDKLKGPSLNTLLLAAVILVSSFLLVSIFDYTRFLRILHVPLKIFEAPVILFAFNGQNMVLQGQTLIIVVAMNLLAIQGILLLLRYRNNIKNYQNVLGFAFATCTLFLASPFLGLEWANRLFMMAYIPITGLYLIIYNSIAGRWLKIPTTVVFILLLSVSFTYATFSKPMISISKNAYLELQQIQGKVLFSNNDAIVGRQDLRLLANWTLGTKGVSDYLLTKGEFNKYRSVYILKQINGKNSQMRSVEPKVEDSYTPIFTGLYFEIYKINDNSKLSTEPQKIFKGVKGTIIEILPQKILVKDYKNDKIRTVFIHAFDAKSLNIHTGMKVAINGEWIPFSLSLKAETIKGIENFD